MKDLLIIAHQRGEHPVRYYSSLQNNIGDILAETDVFDTPEDAERMANELIGMLNQAEPYICAGYYYYAIVRNGTICLRTRSSDTARGAKAILNELVECAKGEVIHYAHYVRSDVGVLEKVLLRLDNPKACPEWYLREILVDNLSGGGS